LTDHVDVPARRDLFNMAFRRVRRMRFCPQGASTSLELAATLSIARMIKDPLITNTPS
jgi:hypothetical protein